MKIAVVGATGPTGIHLVTELRKTVAGVRVIARSTDRLARLFPETAVEKWPADVLDADATLRAIEGPYRDPTGAGGTGAPSRSAFIDRRALLAPDSLAGLFLLSLPPSVGFFASSPFFGGEAGLNAVGWGAISETSLMLAPGRGHEKSSARPAGACKTSPRLRTFAATGSGVSCFW